MAPAASTISVPSFSTRWRKSRPIISRIAGRLRRMTDLVAGRLHYVFDGVATSLGYAQAGTIRMLGVAGLNRSPVLPDLPTISEAAVPGFDTMVWFGLFAPAATPKPVVDLVNSKTNAVLASSRVKEGFAKLGIEAVGGSPTSSPARYRRKYRSGRASCATRISASISDRRRSGNAARWKGDWTACLHPSARCTSGCSCSAPETIPPAGAGTVRSPAAAACR